LGIGCRELRIHVHYWSQNSTIWIHTCQRIRLGGQRYQPARMAPGWNFVKNS
jgi:hypothetical protein